MKLLKNENCILYLKGLTKEYVKGKRILEDIDFKLNEREHIAIIGESGIGKSTLLNIIGLLDMEILGEYYLDKINVSNLKDKELSNLRNEKIGFVFQSYHLIPNMTAYENIILPVQYSIKHIPNLEKRVDKLLKILNIEVFKNRKVDNLSGGEKQRVAIARALILEPRIILCDEPTGNLDKKNTDIVIKTLKELNLDSALVLVTHDWDIAKNFKKVYEIKNKSIVEVVSLNEEC